MHFVPCLLLQIDAIVRAAKSEVDRILVDGDNAKLGTRLATQRADLVGS